MSQWVAVFFRNLSRGYTMLQFFKHLTSILFNKTPELTQLNKAHRAFLTREVGFYRGLERRDQARFEARCVSFINTTQFIGHQTDVTDEDCLLVAAGSVILAWGFEKWHYVKVDIVYLVGTVISHDAGAVITGLVGNQHLSGKMVLSKPALHQGFSNDRDKRNVAIHEFAHLIDLADGDADGLPKELVEKAFALPWLDLVKKKMTQIERKQGDIRAYGGTNNAEFFAVASEYFFERPKRLEQKHPELYQALRDFYQQDRAAVTSDLRVSKKAPCPCGSGKRYKRCCLPQQA